MSFAFVTKFSFYGQKCGQKYGSMCLLRHIELNRVCSVKKTYEVTHVSFAILTGTKHSPFKVVTVTGVTISGANRINT